MNEQTFFADVDLPFHVWVKERCATRGYRWVLRDASHLHDGGTAHTRAGTPDRTTSRRSGAPPA